MSFILDSALSRAPVSSANASNARLRRSITNTDGRKAYAHSENYEPHFAHIPADAAGLERAEDGSLKFSFVNLMAFHRPLVIVDEAHRAGTSLSFDMLPYAEERKQPALNRAYTHVSSPRFGEGAKALTDTLVEKMGFEPDEAAGVVEQRQATLPGLDTNADLFTRAPVLLETLDASPDLSGLAPEVAERVKVETRDDGTVTVTVQGDIPQELEQRLVATMTPDRQERVRQAVQRHRVAHRNSTSPAERGEKFPVPRLFLQVQGELELAEKETILDLGGWSLNRYAAELTPSEFTIHENAERWEVDLRGEKVIYKHVEQSAQLEIGLLKLDWTDLQLSRWLDKECRQTDVTQPVLLEFCRKTVAHLTTTRGLALNDLLRFKFQLAKAVQQKIATYRQQAFAADYQTFLFGSEAQVTTGFADGFAFENRPYPASWLYSGALQFKKHFFGSVGEMKASGEEFECAKLLDAAPQVKFWIRNLSQRPDTSFWLQTSTDRFYPDFVAMLQNGRLFVVEYKGEPYVTNDDSREKTNVGELWASKSGGKGLFLMAQKQDTSGKNLQEQLQVALRV